MNKRIFSHIFGFVVSVVIAFYILQIVYGLSAYGRGIK